MSWKTISAVSILFAYVSGSLASARSGIIFFLFVIAIYYASKTNVHGSNPFVSAKQYIASGGIMNTPGAY